MEWNSYVLVIAISVTGIGWTMYLIRFYTNLIKMLIEMRNTDKTISVYYHDLFAFINNDKQASKRIAFLNRSHNNVSKMLGEINKLIERSIDFEKKLMPILIKEKMVHKDRTPIANIDKEDR